MTKDFQIGKTDKNRKILPLFVFRMFFKTDSICRNLKKSLVCLLILNTFACREVIPITFTFELFLKHPQWLLSVGQSKFDHNTGKSPYSVVLNHWNLSLIYILIPRCFYPMHFLAGTNLCGFRFPKDRITNYDKNITSWRSVCWPNSQLNLWHNNVVHSD